VEKPAWSFARTFTLAVSRHDAFRLLSDPGETAAWLNPVSETEAGDLEMNIEGNPPRTLTVDTYDPPGLLRTTMTGGVIPGAMEITVVFEDVDSGTRITITRADKPVVARNWKPRDP
jgi:hypothetical protein